MEGDGWIRAWLARSFPSKNPVPATPHSALRAPHSCWRHNGNVARLPKAVRDRINQMIQDGLTYPAILENLGEQSTGLSVVNLSRWKNGGYQDWLLEQAFTVKTRDRLESASQVTRDLDATQANHAALQLGTLHIFEALRDLGPGSLAEKLGGDCMAFARLINALARASRETLLLQKHRDACARARAAIQELKDPKRKLDESETRAIVLKVDDILGLRSSDHDENPPPTDSSPSPGGEGQGLSRHSAFATADEGQPVPSQANPPPDPSPTTAA